MLHRVEKFRLYNNCNCMTLKVTWATKHVPCNIDDDNLSHR